LPVWAAAPIEFSELEMLKTLFWMSRNSHEAEL